MPITQAYHVATKDTDTMSDPTNHIVRQEGDPSKWKYTDDEMQAFNIDREQEDAWVKEYQLTGNAKLLEHLYLMREPTLRVWARKAFYIGDSEDDVFADLRVVWQRSIGKYRWAAEKRNVRTKQGGIVKDKQGNNVTVFKRTNFNTYLFTSIKNHISNVNKKRYSKKRLDGEGKPVDKSTYSLDRSFEEDGDTGLHETLKDNCFMASSTTETEFVINTIADGDKEIRAILLAFAANPGATKLSSACNHKHVYFPVTQEERAALLAMPDEQGGEWVSVRMVKAGLNGKFKKFKLIGYSVFTNRVECEYVVKDVRLMRKLKAFVAAAKDKM